MIKHIKRGYNLNIEMMIKKAIDTIYGKLLKVKKKENVLIICDKNTKKIAEKFFEYGHVYGDHSLCLEIKVGKRNGEEPENEVGKLFLRYDVIIIITTKSLSHTNSRKKATAQGARIFTSSGINENILKRCVDIDYKKMGKLHDNLYKHMKKVKNVRITSKKGTDLSFKIYNNKIEYSCAMDKKGSFTNIPLGEVFVAPKEKTAEGVFVVDGSFAGVGKLKKPIVVEVKEGYATDINGGKEAKQLIKILKSVKSKNAFNIAELGIGTNPKAKISGSVIEDEKVLGTCHIALGSNFSFGGKVKVPIHLDGIINKPTIYFDDKIIMKNGKFMI